MGRAILLLAMLVAACASEPPTRAKPAASPAPPPAVERVPYSSLVLLQPVSIGARYHGVTQYTLPPANTPATLDCSINRKSGVVESCALIKEGESGYAFEFALKTLILGARYDVSRFDQASPIELRSDFPVAISPADYPQPPAPPARLLRYSEVAWASEAKPESIERAFNIMRRRKRPAMDVVYPCRIQTDFSLICLPPRSDPAGVNLEPVSTGPLVRDLRAAPTLPGGGPSAGAWVELRYPIEAQPYDLVAPAPAMRKN